MINPDHIHADGTRGGPASRVRFPRRAAAALPAALAAFLLAAAACAAEDPPAVPTDAAPAVEAPTATEAPAASPEEPTATEPAAADTESTATESPCPDGLHSHDGEACHPDEPAPAVDEPAAGGVLHDPLVTEDEKEPLIELDEPAEDDGPVEPATVVECGDGLTLMEEFVTDTDNGCRPAVCEAGRNDDGDCLLVEEELTEQEAAAVADQPTIPFDDYAPDFDCEQTQLGVCEDAEGTLHCHDTNTGWAECPGQPSGDTCEHDPTNPLSLAGHGEDSSLSWPTVTLPRGTWSVVVCLTDNHIETGTPGAFLFVLLDEANILARFLRDEDEPPVESGRWTFDDFLTEAVYEATGIDEFNFTVYATPEGGGSWTARFWSSP